MNERNIKLDDAMPLIKEKLASGGSVTLSPRGTSMLPLLRPGVDSVVIKKAPDKLKKHDLPLYRRQNGDFVLHRVVKAIEGEYVMRGDNQNWCEYGIKHEQILALAVGMYKNGEYISFNSVKYWIYTRKRYLRRILSRLKNKIRKT